MDQSNQEHVSFDADQQQLGDVYAKALLGFGQENGKADLLVEQLAAVTDVVRQVPGLAPALESPRIGLDEKSNLLEKAFGDKVERSLLNFLKVVGSKGRFDCLDAIVHSAKKMQDEQAGRVQAVLTSAAEVDESERTSIAQRMSQLLGKTVSLATVIDPKIIGGVIVRVGDTVYDGSVLNQLDQLRAQAVKHSADVIREHLDRFATT